MSTSYLDFELEIGADDGNGHPLHVLQSPAGNTRSYLRLALGDLELENRLLALQNALLRSGGQRRKLLSADERTVQNFGRELFAALFHDDIRSLYFESQRIAESQDKGLRIKLRINAPDLAVLPWEYLFDERRGEYVSLSQSTPLVRTLETAQPPQPLAVTPPLRILGMVASPPNLAPINVALEKERMERALAGLRQAGLVQLEWLPGSSWRDLSRAMRLNQGPWHIFHFVGHGLFDPQRDEGLLAMTDENNQPRSLYATELARILGDHPSLRLALLNACEGALASRSDIFASTAATLVRRGVPAVIAMQVEISDRAAIEFSTQFYEALADGLPVDTAVTEARKAVSLAIENTLEWGIPILLSRAPDGVLFDIALPAAAPAAKPAPPPLPTPTPVAEPPTVQVESASRALRLSGAQVGELQASLLDAYPNESVLRQMVRIQLDQRLDVLAGGGSLSEIVFNLIAWAEAHDRVLELVTRAQQQTPGNRRLAAFAATLPGATVAAPSAPLIASPIAFDWVTIPAGAFLMGSDNAQDAQAYDWELPQHTLHLPTYHISRTPVTVAQFAAFVQATGYKTVAEERGSGWVWNGKDWDKVKGANWAHPAGLQSDVTQKQDHPVTQVYLRDAQQFCLWAKVRLPSEAEWEKAARGADGFIFPWGNNAPTEKLCNFNQKIKDTTPVGAYAAGASPFGCLDMAGNVWEWTSSLWGKEWQKPDYGYPYDANDGRENEAAPETVWRVVRGGSWYNDARGVRCAARYYFDWGDALGFRVVTS